MHFDLFVTALALFCLLLMSYLVGYALQPRSLAGVVLDEKGGPLIGALVQLTDLSNAEVRPCRTDVQGRFYFGNLRKTVDYEIAVEHKDNLSESILLRRSALHCELELKFELVLCEEYREPPRIVLREGIADPNWFGVS